MRAVPCRVGTVTFLRRGLAVLVLAFAVGAVNAVAPPGALALAPTSATHPFSDPWYFPVHAAVGLDCVRTNPGCAHPRDFWSIDVVPAGQFGPNGHTSRAGVYAMGAGIVHYGVEHGAACPASPTSFGTWIWIDHGGGYVSRYGHLSEIRVANGTRVAPGQLIGVVGSTGKGGNCTVTYTDFELFHTGVMSTSVQIPPLRACVGTSTSYVLWPAAATPYSTWNAVPQNTQFPLNNGNCLPTSVPKTAFHPSSTSITRSGSGQLTVRWAAPSPTYHVTRVEAELSLRHSDGSYDQPKNEKYVLIDPAKTSYEFSGLAIGHTYRLRVSFHNYTGWSYPSTWQSSSVS